MTQVTKSNAPTSNAKAIVLFGLSEDGKPQAGIFPEAQASLAKKAAKELRLEALNVSAAELASFGTKIPAGKLYANRRSFIPNVRKDLHQKLVEFAKGGSADSSRGGSSGSPPLPPSAGIPKNWESVAPGHQILVQSSLPDGWWESIVLKREGEILTVRFRDYPKEAPFTVHLSQIALQQSQPKPSQA
jgi:hypothetical protein